MANRLVERLCQTEAVAESLHIPLNPFEAGILSVLGGYHSFTAFKNFFSMSPEDEQMMDVIAAAITSKNGEDEPLAAKLAVVHRVRAIFTFWEMRDDISVPGYDDVDDIEAQLNAL